MNRETAPAYDYQAKGASDFAAGRKDERLYANPENHGASYRRGWQQARRDAEARQDPSPAPGTTPEAIAARVADDQNLAEETRPPFAVVSDPVGIFRQSPHSSSPPVVVTAEDVRLQTGEDKPKKPKPADPDQLAFF